MANLTATSPTWSFTTAGVATPNTGPTITLTQPVAGGNYTAPASVTLAANASDSDGSVTQVEFLANGAVVATVVAAPFTATWSNVPAGTYSITARAWDNRSAVTTSAPVTVTVATAVTPLTARHHPHTATDGHTSWQSKACGDPDTHASSDEHRRTSGGATLAPRLVSSAPLA